MDKLSLDAVAREEAKRATEAAAGRSSRTIYGGHDKHLRQTVIALSAGETLSEHENPGEATIVVLEGRLRLTTDQARWDGRHRDLLVVPQAKHAVEALSDTQFLLTVVKP